MNLTAASSVLLLAVAAPLARSAFAAPEERVVSPSPEASEPDPELVALFDYDREGDLDVEELDVLSMPDYERIDLTYASPAGGRVPAYLYMPGSDGPQAGLLLMHGMPGSREDGAGLADRYARSGAVVLAISAPWARPDGPREEILSFTPRDRDEQIQLIQDLRRGVDLLLSFPWVDHERIGYAGGSYGGAMGGLLAGVEPRIQAFALAVGDGGLLAHFTSPGDPVPPPHVPRERWDAWVEAMDPIEPIRFVRHAAPSHLLFQNGRTDQMVPAADAEAYQEAGSEPKTILWYEGGHALDQERIDDQARWLAERIGISPTPSS